MKKIFAVILALISLGCFSANAQKTMEELFPASFENGLPVGWSISQDPSLPLMHPCMLHTQADIDYTRAHLDQDPWKGSYRKLINSSYCKTSYTASPVKYLARLDANNWASMNQRWINAGLEDEWYEGIHNNYNHFFRDCAAAYQLALKYVLTDDAEAAECAIRILNDWATVNKGLLLGRDAYKDDVIDPNEYLIMFQIHQAANAAELLRSYNGWGESDEFLAVVDWLKTYFYPFCSKFLANNVNDHSWMNWDLASMTAILAIGILDNNEAMINEAVNHFKNSQGPGCIAGKAVICCEPDPSGTGVMLAQGNESGRDQGHNTLCGTLLGTFCQMACNVGEDLFAYDDYRAVAFARYVAKYNKVKDGVDPLGTLDADSFKYDASTLPFRTYTYSGKTMTGISDAGRGSVRPGWDIWVGYCRSHGLPTTYLDEYAEQFSPDGGGGNYGPNSGGFDQLGFSTLMHYRP